MPYYCSACGNPVGSDAKFCSKCGQTLVSAAVSEPVSAEAPIVGEPAAPSAVDLPPVPAPPPPPAPAKAWAPWVQWSPQQRRRYLLLAGGGGVAILVTVLAVVLAGGGGNTVTATHPSGVGIVAEVESGGTVSIDEIEVYETEVAEQLDPGGAWEFRFSGELTGPAVVTIPQPGPSNFGVMAYVDGGWHPVPFSLDDSGQLRVEIDAGQLGVSSLSAAAPTALAAGDVPGLARRSNGDDLLEWGFRLMIVVFDSVDAASSYAWDQANGLYEEWSGYITDYAFPEMCSQPLAGVEVDDDANAGALVQVCVEDDPAGPLIKVGNNTRFALEVSATGADIRHDAGGIDVTRLGGRGVVVSGGDVTAWTSGGRSVTFTAEFTEYAFLRQVSVWIIDLIPAGSDVLERGEDLADAISLLQDALETGGNLEEAVKLLADGEYRDAFEKVVDLLTQEAVIEELVENGCIERLVGFHLDEEMLGEVFSALELAGSVADLGSLIYTTWQTGGYVHGEVTVRLPEVTTTADQGTSTQQTTTQQTTTTFAGSVDMDFLGSITAAEAPATFTFELPDSYDRVLCTTYDAENPDSSSKYGGWAAWMEVNGFRVFEWVEFDGTDSLYADYLSGETVYGGTGVGEWFDITGLVAAGSNEIVFYHYNEGPGVGIKIAIEHGGAQTGSTLAGDLGTGDVQVTLVWSTVADLDLHVVDPFGEEVWFDDPLSSSGGELDVDMHSSCEGSSSPVENVFWPPGSAPRGSYRAMVHFYGACEGSDTASFEVIVHLDGVERHRFEGTVTVGETASFDFSY
jgi:hypothetical protein